MKKKFILFILIGLIILFIIIKKINTTTIKYKIKSNDINYSVTEKYNKKYYYFEIVGNKKVYPINVFGLKKSKKQITKIYSYKDCILPIFKDKALTDMMCYIDNTLYNYQSIKGTDVELDKYVKSIGEYTLNVKDSTEDKYNNVITFYNDIDKNISISTYKGIIVNKKEIKLFDKDIYNNKISTYIDKYYVTADYNLNYEFDKFYVVNLKDGEVSTIKTKEPISFDSYIQGIVDNKIYIFDPENEIQYRINPNNKDITITSNDYIKYYSNNKWTKVSVKQAKKELLFDYSTLDNKYSDYDYVIENDYYYYLIKENKLYRINKNNNSVINYLFEIPTNSISINDNYLYYVDNNNLYYYSDELGLKIVLENKELEFNKYIKYYIY